MTPRLPIAIVMTSFEPGGTERQMTELIARLDPERFAVHVACLRREGLWLDKVARAAVEVAEFRIHGFVSPSMARQLARFARWCRSRGLRVVHTTDFYTNVFGLTGSAVARVPVRIASRRDLVLPGRTARQHALQRGSYRLAHRVVANSEAAGAQVIEEGVPRARVAVIPNGIDLDRYGAPTTRPSRRIVTTVANLRAEKGHDVLLDAAATVLRQRPDVVFQFAGNGPRRAALEQQAQELGVDGAIRFLGHCEDVPALLRDSDLFVLPSRSEAFPNGVMEAMAARLPVVASNVGGIPELIAHERNGLLVPPGDAAALAAGILRVLQRPDEAAALAAEGRHTVEERYSFDRMVREFERLYLDECAARLSNTFPLPSHARG